MRRLLPLGVVLLALTFSLLAAACTSEQRVARSSPPGTSVPAGGATGVLTAAPPSRTGAGTAFPDLGSLIEQVRPAVVAIHVETLQPNFFLLPVPVEGAGTGIIIDSTGYIVTNNHVIEGARTIRVTLPDGRSFPATLVGRDPLGDLAVVKVEGQGLSSLTLAANPDLRVGDWVIAIGNALNLEGGPTVTVGVVSALGREILTDGGVTLFDLVQTDAAINPGNSGGALLTLKGEVVGINTAIAAQGQGIGFAINTRNAKPIVDDLIAKGRVLRAQLGVFTQEVTPELAKRLNLPTEEGVVIARVVPGSPAEKVGLRQGDTIVEIDGQKVRNTPRLQFLIWKRRVGDVIQVKVLRDGQERVFTVALGERPPETAVPFAFA